MGAGGSRIYADGMTDVLTKPAVARIEAHGVLDEFDYAVDFASDSTDAGALRVIYAENGMGKTTFLRSVYYLLTPDLESMQSLYELALRNVTVTLTTGVTVVYERSVADVGGFRCAVIQGDGQEVGVLVPGEEADARNYRRVSSRHETGEYLQALREAVAPTVLVGDDRLIYSVLDAPGVASTPRPYRDERELRYRMRVHTSSVRDTLERVEKAFSRIVLRGVTRDSSDASAGVYLDITKRILAGAPGVQATEAKSSLLERARHILAFEDFETYGLISLRQVRGLINEFEATRANDARFKNLYPILDPFLTNLAARVETLAPAHRLIDTFVTSVNGFLSRKSLRFTTVDGVSLIGRRGDLLDPDALSSGEKHLLLLLSNAVLATFTGSLVIIDEPELSLGIEWQRSLLAELLRCTEGSGVQFLVASHSVQIMGEIEDVVRPTERTE